MVTHPRDATADTHSAARANAGPKPCFSLPNLCVRTHMHAISYAVAPNHRRWAVPRRSPFSVPLPSARHQFHVAAMAAPSAFGTHTNARNRGAEPLLHLSVTMLDIPPCRRREPQRTGTCVFVEQSTPGSNLFGHLDPEHRLA
jgi:hypothetical protein